MLFDVAAYGAKGDGLADDTTAIERAFYDLNARAGGVLYFPPLTYRVSRPLILSLSGHFSESVLITGYGALIRPVHAEPVIQIVNAKGHELRNLVIEGLKFINPVIAIKISNAENTGNTYRWLLRDLDAEQVRENGYEITGNVFEGVFENCFAWAAPANTTGFGLYLRADSNGKLSSIRIRDCNTRGFRHGLFCGRALDIMVDGGTYLQARKAGINLTGQPFTLLGVHAENNWQEVGSAISPNAGIQVAGYGTVAGCRSWAENKQKFGIRVYADSQPVSIIGATFPVQGEKMYYIDGSVGSKVSLFGVPQSQVEVAGSPEVSFY